MIMGPVEVAGSGIVSGNREKLLPKVHPAALDAHPNLCDESPSHDPWEENVGWKP
jgi:hypothetical protein